MDDTLLFIPPCCVDSKLPRAVMQAPNRTLQFYTHGDVTMEKFYRAISYLVDGPHIMALTISDFSTENAVFIQQCFERKWISHLILSTGNAATAQIDRYLSEYKERILYTSSDDSHDESSHMVLYNNHQAMILVGPMYSRLRAVGLTAYTLTFYPSMALFSSKFDWGNPIRNTLLPDVLRHRKQERIGKCKPKSQALKHFIDMDFPPYE